MQPETPTDHIALLALMMVRVLAGRMGELGLLDDATRTQIRRLVAGMRTHAEHENVDLTVLLDNLVQSVKSKGMAAN